MQRIAEYILRVFEGTAAYICGYQKYIMVIAGFSFFGALLSVRSFSVGADDYIFFLSLFGMSLCVILFVWAVFFFMLCSTMGGRSSGESYEYRKSNQRCSELYVVAILLIPAAIALLITAVSLLFLLSPFWFLLFRPAAIVP